MAGKHAGQLCAFIKIEKNRLFVNNMICKSESPLVSVLIPCYNHQQFVDECILSIVNQSYKNIELLVMDDGSDDCSFLVIKNRLKVNSDRFSRVVFRRSKNQGIVKTLNSLLNEAKGKYLYIIASDDRSRPDAIQTLVSNLEDNDDSVLAVGDNAYIDAEGGFISVDKKFRRTKREDCGYKTVGDIFNLNNIYARHRKRFGKYSDLIFGNYIPNGYLLRRDAVAAIGGYNERIFPEDWYMNLQLSKHGAFRYIPEILFDYRLHGRNTIYSDSFKRNSLRFALQIYRSEFDYCLRNGKLFVLVLALIKQIMPSWLKRSIKSIFEVRNERQGLR